MTKSPPVAVVGSQRPRIELLPKSAFTDSGDDAVDLCRDVAGFHLDDWQEYVLRSMLGERLDYKWSASTVGLIVPRQQGKSAVLEARCLAGLFLFSERILYTAKLLDTSTAIFERTLGMIRSAPDLDAQVVKVLQNNNGSEIVLRSGAKLEIGARTPDQGRGKSFDCLILDEAYGVHQKHLTALRPTLTTAENSQVIWASSAGMPDSHELEKLRNRGMDKASKSLAYFEWSAPDDADPDDIGALAQANPGLGIRMSMDHVADERAEFDEDEFKRERLGIWAQIGGDSKVTDSEWSRVLDPDSKPGEFASFAIDIPPDRASANVAAISRRADGVLHGQILERRNGVSWVPDFLREIQQAWGTNATPVVIDAGSAAGSLIPELERRRVRLMYINAKQHGAACAQVYDDIVERRMFHRGQVELDEAVANAKTKPLGDSAWKWAKTDATADISPLIALTLARHGWSTRGERKQLAAERQSQGGRVRGRPVRGRTPVGRGGR